MSFMSYRKPTIELLNTKRHTAKKICNREIYPEKYPYILFNLAQAYLENEQTNNSLACINEILSITQPDVDIYIYMRYG